MKFISFFFFLTSLMPLSVQSQERINEDIDKLYHSIIHEGRVDYKKALKNRKKLNQIIKDLAECDISEYSTIGKKAFHINAYNLLTIQSILPHYPISSVQKIDGFFDKQHSVGEQSLNLDQLENEIGTQDDPRLHMVLVCGASSCPPFFPEVITEDRFEDQMSAACKIALHSEQFIKVSPIDKKVFINQIFKWNSFEFEDLIGFINENSDLNIPYDFTVQYQPYNWSLNDIKALELSGNTRYFASRLYGKGEFEASWFNNYYSQLSTDPIDIRSNFFSSFFNYYMGLGGQVNVGLELKFRSVSYGPSFLVGRWESLQFSQSGFGIEGDFSRIGFTAITPKIKYNPFSDLSNVSLQHAISIPLLYSGEGNTTEGYIDWSTPSLYNDIYYDQVLSEKASLFLQLGIYIENLGPLFKPSNNGFYQFSTPITVIPSVFINDKTTVYILINASPKWGFDVQNDGDIVNVIPDHYNQYGVGFKYFLTQMLEGELLYTKFFSSTPDRSAATFNLGFRYFGWK